MLKSSQRSHSFAGQEVTMFGTDSNLTIVGMHQVKGAQWTFPANAFPQTPQPEAHSDQ